MGFLLSFLLGFLPMLVFAAIIYWLDRYEKEPGLLLGGVFLWGAFVAAGAALLINTLLGTGIYLFTRSETTANFATGALIAPLVEETLKGLAVLVVFLLARSEFDSFLDGVIYAAIAALGFAATENVYYIYEYGYKGGGFAGVFGIAGVRIFLVGWQHPFYTAFFGIGLAAARLSRKPDVRWLAPLAGFALAVILHSVHNLIGSLIQNEAGLAAGALFDWSGWTMMLLFILWAIARERAWIVEQMQEEVSLGIISAEQYLSSCSSWRRSRACLRSLFSGGFFATRRFYQVCSELAYKKHQLRLMGEEGGNSRIIAQLRQELTQLRGSAQT